MHMQLFGNDVIFSSSHVLVSSNCKQSITVRFLQLTFYWHCFKAWWDLPIVCRCKTIFPLVGPTKHSNDVSKMLTVKNQTVIDCLQSVFKIRTDEKMTSFRKLVHCIFILWANTQCTIFSLYWCYRVLRQLHSWNPYDVKTNNFDLVFLWTSLYGDGRLTPVCQRLREFATTRFKIRENLWN